MAEELENEYLRIEEDIVAALRTVYDPEIPVNVYDLGLIYCVELTDEMFVTITMTLTAPNCPAADFILEECAYEGRGRRGGHGCRDTAHLRARVEQGYDETKRR